MWSYYGSKSKIAKLYPEPRYSLIIEPFAGAAWYSVLHRDRDVLLNEKNVIVHDIWEWLINEATREDILNNTNFYCGQDINTLNLQEYYRDLVGFCINRGSVSPKSIVQKWSCQVKADPLWASTTSYQLKRIAKLLPEIRHWQTRFGDYSSLPDVKATWFIDPPYQSGGICYPVNDVDYLKLAEWCGSRRGQVIVCEGGSADWLPFEPLGKTMGQRKKTVEVVWLN